MSRLVGVVAALFAILVVLSAPALAQTPQNPAFDAAKAAADGLGRDEIAAIQRDLIWTGDLNTLASGEFGRRSFDAIKALQKRLKAKDTGILLPAERAALAKAAARYAAGVGFTLVEEEGVSVGYPAKRATKRTMGKRGPKFSSPSGDVTVDILSYPAEEEAYEALFERLKAERPGREVSYSLIRPDAFVVTGTVDGMKFYMRFLKTDTDTRGFSVGWKPELSPGFDRVPIAMAVSLGLAGAAVAEAAEPQPQPQPHLQPESPAGPPIPLPEGASRAPRSGLGILVSDGGDVLTSAAAVAGCRTVTPDGRVVAGDPVNGLALVRLAAPPPGRATALRRVPLVANEAMTVHAGPSAPAGAATVAGLAGPGGDTRRFILAASAPGGGVFDTEGSLAGLITREGEATALKPLFISAFLRAQGVTLAGGHGGEPGASLVALGCTPD